MVEYNPPPMIFEVTREDLVTNYDWPVKKDGVDIQIDCSFPLKCEVVFETETQKTYLIVSITTNDPDSNNIYSIDFFDTTKDLVSMGFIERENYDDFIDYIVTNSPNRDKLNYLDSTGATINGYSGVFELKKCLNQYGDICTEVTNPKTNEVIAEIPIYPINELEFAIRQRNIKIEKESTDQGVSGVTNSGLGSALFLATIFGPLLYIKYKIDVRSDKIAAKRKQQEIDDYNRGIENAISELESKIDELREEKG